MPSCPAISAGSGGIASANSISISSTTSRGAEANSSTISASFGGMSLTTEQYAGTSGRRRRRKEGDITQADDADDLAIGVTDQQPPDTPVAHRLDRLLHGRRLLHHDQLAGGDRSERGRLRWQVLGDRPDH